MKKGRIVSCEVQKCKSVTLASEELRSLALPWRYSSKSLSLRFTGKGHYMPGLYLHGFEHVGTYN